MSGFRTDKVGHGYLPTYLRFAAAIGTRGRVLEIGVAGGDSLVMWQHLFPEGLVVGVDNGALAPAKWPEGTVRVDADMTDPALPEHVTGAILQAHRGRFGVAAEFDLIVEDAVHKGKESAACLDRMWHQLVPGGWYVIEDWYVGFPSWPSYDDSMRDLAGSLLGALEHPPHHPAAVIDVFAEDGPFNVFDPSDVESITYRYGMIILEKAA